MAARSRRRNTIIRTNRNHLTNKLEIMPVKKKAPAKKTTTKRVSKSVGLTSCGTHLKKGYKYVKGGGVVKVTAKKTTTKKKK